MSEGQTTVCLARAQAPPARADGTGASSPRPTTASQIAKFRAMHAMRFAGFRTERDTCDSIGYDISVGRLLIRKSLLRSRVGERKVACLGSLDGVLDLFLNREKKQLSVSRVHR